MHFRSLFLYFSTVPLSAPVKSFAYIESHPDFMLGSGGEITPVTGFTGQKLAELIGYEREKRRITENTEALVPGKAESNVRFTAVPEQEKSTVKAIANEFAASRLIAEAETFSLRKSGRSPRCAKQYVELICAGVNTTKAGKAL